MVGILKYIGHFMRINVLTKENIKNQLFFFSKETLQNTILNSKCGITIPSNEVRIKNISLNDINISNSISPLLCIYKKASCKLINTNDSLLWNEEKFKKEICITGNSLMTLCLLELVEYFQSFKNSDEKKYLLSNYYLLIAQKQLDFYISYFRNSDGVFVDKTDLSDIITNEVKFEDKNKNFDFADQAFLMAALYKYYDLSNSKNCQNYKNFSLEILAMFLEYKDELYEASMSKLSKLCLGLQTFYNYSKNLDALNLLIDLSDLIDDKFSDEILNLSEKNLSDRCLVSINYFSLYKVTGIIKFKDYGERINNKLIELYDPVSGIFLKDSEKKEIIYSCDEIVLYLITLILQSELDEKNNDINLIILDVYKHVLINSGIISSWPEAPSLDDAERYENFSMDEKDFLDDYNFRMENIATPENSEMAPVYLKNVTFNRKKASFVQNKFSFDSTKNMFINFITISLFKKISIDACD